MKHIMVYFALIVVTLSLSAAETLVAHWDFSKNTINSTQGRFNMIERGATAMAGDKESGHFLKVVSFGKKKPQGIISLKKHPELSPAGGFRLESVFRLHATPPKTAYMLLWDNKYLTYSRKEKNPKFHCGFAVGLLCLKNGDFRPVAFLGFGERTACLFGKPIKLEAEKKYTLTFSYDGINKAQFKLDGILNKELDVSPGGNVMATHYKTVIGDRYGSNYNPFDGDIFEMKLFSNTNSVAEEQD